MYQQFAETNALLAIIKRDFNQARTILADFYDSELGTFDVNTAMLQNLIVTEQRRRKET